MKEGCSEKMDIEYLKFLEWIWTYPKARTPEILKMLEDLKETKRVLILQSPREVKVFLEVLKASTERRA